MSTEDPEYPEEPGYPEEPVNPYPEEPVNPYPEDPVNPYPKEYPNYGGDVLGGSDIVGGTCCEGGDPYTIGGDGYTYGGDSYYGGMESQINLKTEAIVFIDAVLVVFVIVLIVVTVGAWYADSKVPEMVKQSEDYKSMVDDATRIPMYVVGGLVATRVVVGLVM
jgi:hypothetical protein